MTNIVDRLREPVDFAGCDPLMLEAAIEIERLRGVAQAPFKLGDLVEMNSNSPYYGDWIGAKLKIVSLRIDPEGKHWVSVIEGSPRHRANGVYDSETTDIDADYLSAISSTTRRGPCQCCSTMAELSCGPSRFGDETWACVDCWGGPMPPAERQGEAS